MKIDICLTATNTKSNYIKHIPTFINSWLRLNIKPFIILINNTIPNEYLQYSEYISLFNPSEYGLNNINTGFIAQLIRIYYPALFIDKNIIISDIDIVPISYDFFVNKVEPYNDNMFINYRRYNGQLNICYNLANSKTWHELFKINSISDIVTELSKNYNPNYDGQKNCQGWFSDQEILTNTIKTFDNNRVFYIDTITKIKRIDKRERATILKNIEQILENISNYHDFHITTKNSVYTQLSNRIIDKILKLSIY